MGQLTNYAEGKILDHVLKVGSYSPVANIYVGLFSATPGAGGGGTEVAYTNYQRQVIAFSAASGRSIANSGTITFPQCGVAGDTAAYWGLFDAQTVGNLLAYGTLASSKNIVSGNTPSFAAAACSVSVNAGAMFSAFVLQVLDWLFRQQTLNQPTNVKIGLSTSTPQDDGTGITEPVGNGYAQVNANAWDAASGNPRTSKNNGTITIGPPTGSWGLITYSVLYLDTTKAFYGTVPNQTPGNGDTVDWLDEQYTVAIQ